MSPARPALAPEQSAVSGRAPTVIIAVGNPMRRDDGIGPAAVAELTSAELELSPPDLAGVDLVVLDGEATRLIDAWTGRRRAIVIDAIVGGAEPGTVHHLVVGRDRLPTGHHGASSHAAGVAEAVALARALDRMPDELILFGVEPADLGNGPELSEPVRDSLPALVEAVISAVASDVDDPTDNPADDPIADTGPP